MGTLEQIAGKGGLIIIIISMIFALTMLRTPLYERGQLIVRPWHIIVFAFAVATAVLIAFTPIEYGTDKARYANEFELVRAGISDWTDRGSDWLFGVYSEIIAKFSSHRRTFFLVTAFLYVGGYVIFAYRSAKNYWSVIFLASASSLGFWGYGMNTLRAGLALSVLFVGISFFPRRESGIDEKMPYQQEMGKIAMTLGEKVVMLAFAFVAVGIHRSMIIPVCALAIAYFFTHTRMIFGGWLVLLALSAFFGESTQAYIGSLFEDSEDARLASYATGTAGLYGYNQGFRVDFLIYSIVPILIGLYYRYKRNFSDPFYVWILDSCIIANGFWLLMIRAIYSDRFAYMSWVFFPIVLFYPLLKKRIFAQQHLIVVAGIIALGAMQILLSLRSLLGLR